MAYSSNAIAGSLRGKRLARALALVGLTTVAFFQPALTQERRDRPSIALQPSPQRSVPGHLQRTIDSLATRAKQAFHARMEPGIPKLILSNIVDARRDLFSVLRDYVRSNFDAAVDALVTDATTDERARAVEHALRTFVEAGQTFASDALCDEVIGRSDAGAAGPRAA